MKTLGRSAVLRIVALCMIATPWLTGCASSRVMSPYYHPKGTDLFYKYGNFCGPGLPVPESEATVQNIALAKSTDPVDDLDRACKIHDLCFLYAGVTAQCDQLFLTLLNEHGSRFGRYTGTGFSNECIHLASEMLKALAIRTSSRSGQDGVDRVFRPAVWAALAPISVAMDSVDGWPSEPGHCSDELDLYEKDVAQNFARAARVHFEVDSRGEINLDRLLPGS